MKLRVAAAAWKLHPAKSDSDYFGHFHDIVSAAHDEGAQVIVVPELHQLELLPIVPDLEEHDAARYLAQYGEAIEEWIQRISESSGLIIVGGSHFKSTEEGIKNVCAVGIPGHGLVIAEKNNLTHYEHTFWDVQPGSGLARLPRSLGVTICYDCEFPEAGRVLAESGMLVQCVPAWTETIQGFQRVRWSCLARAIENQVYVVHASLVGDIGYEPASMSHGSTAIIAPSIEPFPTSAILRETPLNEEGLVVADLDFDLLHFARRSGPVRNWRDRNSGTWELSADPGFPEEEDPRPHLGELN
ncbi:MAG TPA: nitrilase-related carbon-nitrogen hydrolase [Fimbriimonas sp.]|nr:nitrilase-related carbon-nitrogen hydrolase [Fimbriimonas sp.]